MHFVTGSLYLLISLTYFIHFLTPPLRHSPFCSLYLWLCFCLAMFVHLFCFFFFLDYIYKWNHTAFLFFWFILVTTISFMFIYIVKNSKVYGWVIFHGIHNSSLFIHSSVDGHLGCIHILAIVNNAAVNIFFVFFRKILRSGFLDCILILFLISLGNFILFSIVAASMYNSTNLGRFFTTESPRESLTYILEV